MHHVPLDRPGPHDRDFDHQVVEAAGLQPWQHVHLRPAFHLKDADRVRLAEHLVPPRILGGNRGQRKVQVVVLADQRKCFGEHRQHS